MAKSIATLEIIENMHGEFVVYIQDENSNFDHKICVCETLAESYLSVGKWGHEAGLNELQNRINKL